MQYSFAILALAAAVNANPVALPQAVTDAISPQAPPPPGCTAAVSGSFGIAVQNVSTSAGAAKRQASQISDGQVQAMTYGKVSMITDGQIQGSFHTMVLAPVAQIGDGQIQAAKTLAPVTQIIDGQPQAPTLKPSSSSSPSPASAPSVAPSSAAPVFSPSSATTAPSSFVAPPSSSATSTSTPSSSASAAAAPAPSSGSSAPVMVACKAPGELAITLNNGILKDAKGRTGYIASNFQLQFDGPPQAGAIYTAGFSTCSNGTLALGGSSIFYQCLSGNFYNLYDRYWAAQCSPVYINTLMLQSC